MYRLFSPGLYALNPVSFEERRLFFNALRDRQQQSEVPFFTKELADTCPCCGYPVFDPGNRKIDCCLICGWSFSPALAKADLKLALLDARKAFEKELIARPLTSIQPWLGWDTPDDLRLHLVIASAFNSMVGESDYRLLEHSLDFCHQLLSYQSFRRDVGLHLWESHREALESNDEETYTFNEDEVEKTFLEYTDIEEWDYLDHFLYPFHCVTTSYAPGDVIFRSGVEQIDQLAERAWLYFYANLQVDDPLYLFPVENSQGNETVEVVDFTGKRLGFLPELRSIEVLERMDDGEYLSAVVESLETCVQDFAIRIAVIGWAAEWED